MSLPGNISFSLFCLAPMSTTNTGESEVCIINTDRNDIYGTKIHNAKRKELIIAVKHTLVQQVYKFGVIRSREKRHTCTGL